MKEKAHIGLMLLAGFSLVMSGCASDPVNKADLKAFGDQACSGHGGLALVDAMAESAIYTCRDGMTFHLAYQPFTRP